MGKVVLALAYCSAVIDIAFDIDYSWYFVQVPVEWVHCEAEHEDGECASHVNLPDNSWGEELPSDFVEDAPACEEIHRVLNEPSIGHPLRALRPPPSGG